MAPRFKAGPAQARVTDPGYSPAVVRIVGLTTEPLRKFFVLREKFLRKIRLKRFEKFPLILQFLFPLIGFDRKKLLKLLPRDPVQFRKIDIFCPREPTDR
jgi:hypothetical protein